MDKMGFLQELFDRKVISIIKCFFSDPTKEFYLKEISDSVNVPMATTHRILRRLVKLEVLIEKNISRFKVYILANNEKVTFLKTFIKETQKVVEIFVDKIKDLKGITQIILHGKESESRANILIIGDGIQAPKLKEVSGELKEQYNYYISYMTLTPEQYDQMSNMGLYSGQKKVLYEADEIKDATADNKST
jgi:hypothetical protein